MPRSLLPQTIKFNFSPLAPFSSYRMEQQRGIGVPAVINRAVSAPLSVRPAWSDVQHQLHSRRQKDYAFRNTVPIDHDSNCSGLLPDFSKYIAYEHRPTASRPSDEKESNDMNCSGALPSRYSLYSHSRNALSRGSGRESSRLIYPSSNYAASSEGNVSKTELEPYVLFYKGLTARNHSPISDFPMAESMERHCVAKYQHSADESASHILSEDGLRSFKDCRVEESGERHVEILRSVFALVIHIISKIAVCFLFRFLKSESPFILSM